MNYIYDDRNQKDCGINFSTLKCEPDLLFGNQYCGKKYYVYTENDTVEVRCNTDSKKNNLILLLD